MTDAEGVVEAVRSQQEGSAIVLRFVLKCDDGDCIPVEMRGAKVLGVLNEGDRIHLTAKGKGVRGREGVARPDRISNLSTQSLVRVARRGAVGRVAEFVFGLGVSVASGLVPIVIGAVISAAIEAEDSAGEGNGNGEAPIAYILEPAPQAGEVPIMLIALIVGAAVALVVFFFIYVRARRA